MRSNKYGARCANCSQWVKAKTGNLTRRQGRWAVTHRHDCQTATAQTATEPDPVTEIEARQGRSERQTRSAARAQGRADHFQWEAAWAFETGRF